VRPSLGQVLDSNQQVDDRLGGETGHGRAPDVFDGDRPRTESRLQARSLLGEHAGPGGVVVVYLDRAGAIPLHDRRQRTRLRRVPSFHLVEADPHGPDVQVATMDESGSVVYRRIPGFSARQPAGGTRALAVVSPVASTSGRPIPPPFPSANLSRRTGARIVLRPVGPSANRENLPGRGRTWPRAHRPSTPHAGRRPATHQ
jgi:hypothetical protein